MRILICNDDGYQAAGLSALYDALKPHHDVVVMAPKGNKSGFSNALTLRKAIKVREVKENFFRVSGTPADCAHLGVNGFLPVKPDIVISGINHGANLADDVVYSGTVAAAIEGRFCHYPAIAVSLSGVLGGRLPRVATEYLHFGTAAQFVSQLVATWLERPYVNRSIVNINVPNLSPERITGVAVTRLGRRLQSYPVMNESDHFETKKSDKIMRIGPYGEIEDHGNGTDFNAIINGQVSITPLHLDMTEQRQLSDWSAWFEDNFKF